MSPACTKRYMLLSFASCGAAADYILSSLCLSVCNHFLQQDIPKTNLWIFAKFIADNPYILPCKWLTFGVYHVQDSWERIAQNLQRLRASFRKWLPLANHIIVILARSG